MKVICRISAGRMKRTVQIDPYLGSGEYNVILRQFIAGQVEGGVCDGIIQHMIAHGNDACGRMYDRVSNFESVGRPHCHLFQNPSSSVSARLYSPCDPYIPMGLTSPNSMGGTESSADGNISAPR